MRVHFVPAVLLIAVASVCVVQLEAARRKNDKSASARTEPVRAPDPTDPDETADLGYRILNGEVPGREKKDAVKLFEVAASGGIDSAAHNLGYMYETGDGVGIDLAQAFQWYERAARAGYTDAQFRVGLLLYDGRGIERDVDEAVTWFKLAAAKNDRAALNFLAFCHSEGTGTPRDQSEAVTCYLRALMLGDESAATNAARCALRATGPERGELLARITPLLLARIGDATAKEKYYTGLVLGDSTNAKADRTRGTALLEQVRDSNRAAGIRAAQFHLEDGRFADAARVLAADAETGFAPARLYLGTMLLIGAGVPQDVEKGVAMMQETKRLPPLYQSYLHFEGLGVPQDFVRSWNLAGQKREASEYEMKRSLRALFLPRPSVAEWLPANADSEQLTLENGEGAAHPVLARMLGISGDATVEFELDPEGKPANLRVKQASLPLFGEAAIQAMQRWRFAQRLAEPKTFAVQIKFDPKKNPIRQLTLAAYIAPLIPRYEISPLDAPGVQLPPANFGFKLPR